MQSRIETLNEKKCVGKKMTMSLAENKTGLLWKEFMQKRHTIQNAVSSDRYSLQIYPPDYFTDFNPAKTFIKYALVEVTDFNSVPRDMEAFILPGGLYVVFHYIGPASEGAKVFSYIFNEWLPTSDYIIDDRPHFELLGEKYDNHSPDSEEEIWIPVKTKK